MAIIKVKIRKLAPPITAHHKNYLLFQGETFYFQNIFSVKSCMLASMYKVIKVSKIIKQNNFKFKILKNRKSIKNKNQIK